MTTEKDRLFKEALLLEFKGETIENIGKAIKISRVMRIIYSDATLFILSLTPFVIGVIYFSINSALGTIIYLVAAELIVHLFLFKLFFKPILFKSFSKESTEFNSTILILTELKGSKLNDKTNN